LALDEIGHRHVVVTAEPVDAGHEGLLIGSVNADDANGWPRCPRKNPTTPLMC
jgi:hypothetical protein